MEENVMVGALTYHHSIADARADARRYVEMVG